jgi:hypothetical protein
VVGCKGISTTQNTTKAKVVKKKSIHRTKLVAPMVKVESRAGEKGGKSPQGQRKRQNKGPIHLHEFAHIQQHEEALVGKEWI